MKLENFWIFGKKKLQKVWLVLKFVVPLHSLSRKK